MEAENMNNPDLQSFKNFIRAIIKALEDNEPKEKIIEYLKIFLEQ